MTPAAWRTTGLKKLIKQPASTHKVTHDAWRRLKKSICWPARPSDARRRLKNLIKYPDSLSDTVTQAQSTQFRIFTRSSIIWAEYIIIIFALNTDLYLHWVQSSRYCYSWSFSFCPCSLPWWMKCWLPPVHLHHGSRWCFSHTCRRWQVSAQEESWPSLHLRILSFYR